MNRIRLTLLLLVLVCTGCTHTFDANGLAPSHAGYRVDYVEPSRHLFVSTDWRIDNYALDLDETPRAHDVRSNVHLALQHRRTHATLWVDSAVIDRELEQTELRVLADSWVASIASRGYFEATIGGGGAGVSYTDRRFAAEILDARPLVVRGQPAYGVLIDVANLNQAEITPDAREARVLVTFVRLPRGHIVRRGRAVGEDPLLLVAGYSNVPSAFDESMPDYVHFLEAIHFVDDEE